MKGKPSKVAKRRLHEPPQEFAEAAAKKEAEEAQRNKYWYRRFDRIEELVEDIKMPSHPQPQKNKEMKSKGRMTNRARYY